MIEIISKQSENLTQSIIINGMLMKNGLRRALPFINIGF